MYGQNLCSVSVKLASGQTGTSTSEAVTDLADLGTITAKRYNVPTDAQITLTVTDDKYTKRTVVWYLDGNGQYYNALENAAWKGKSITFTMPKGNCYIYTVDDDHALPLDLATNSLSFTSDGFVMGWVQRGTNGQLQTTANKTFTYNGNYVIVQSNIGTDEIAAPNDYELSVASAKMTSNRIFFAKEFSNIGENGGSAVMVRRVYQKCANNVFGTVLENGAKVKIDLDGKNALFRFEMKDQSDLYLNGIHGYDRDVFYINRGQVNIPAQDLVDVGNISGKTGNLTLQNLKLNLRSGYAGYILYAAEKSGSLTMKNVKFTRGSWGDSTGVTRSINTVTIDNSVMDIVNGSSYTTQLF